MPKFDKKTDDHVIQPHDLTLGSNTADGVEKPETNTETEEKLQTSAKPASVPNLINPYHGQGGDYIIDEDGNHVKVR